MSQFVKLILYIRCVQAHNLRRRLLNVLGPTNEETHDCVEDTLEAIVLFYFIRRQIDFVKLFFITKVTVVLQTSFLNE